MKKIIIVLVIIGAVIGFFVFDLNQYLTWKTLNPIRRSSNNGGTVVLY